MYWPRAKISLAQFSIRFLAGVSVTIAATSTAQSQTTAKALPSGYLGASIAVCMKSECATNRGGWVVRVDSASPAWEAGLRRGDTVLSVNAIPLSKSTADALLRFEALKKVVLDVRRGRALLKLSAVTRRR